MKKILLFITVILTLCLIGCGNQKVTDKQMSLSAKDSSKSFELSGSYTGEVDKNGKPVGKGVFKSSNKSGIKWTYEGEFKEGRMEGKGAITWDDGFKLDGNYKNSLANGICKETKNGKLTYEGEYKDGLRDGQGKAYNKDGTKVMYEGQFANNLPNGKGKLFKEDGSLKHEGNFINGVISNPSIGLNQMTNAFEWEYSVTGTKTFKTIGNKQASGIFTMVFVDAKNNSNFARSMGDRFFVLVDEKGRIFDATDLSWDYAKVTNYTSNTTYKNVNPGLTSKQIPFFFDIPEDCKVLYLITEQISPANAIKIKG